MERDLIVPTKFSVCSARTFNGTKAWEMALRHSEKLSVENSAVESGRVAVAVAVAKFSTLYPFVQEKRAEKLS